ncbi:hypothetical protein H2198_010421 [Neophaeococcomyces mojaviensis]|uniref:Uncharacterized protein n=1 Tax=Neophaeococcomyces mojaviensis TaxID=3383035 RepID=A0ACC2ZS22_9EURO|nr:hypothetical protein H2198_010421 [Knufia sp. JES_112]
MRRQTKVHSLRRHFKESSPAEKTNTTTSSAWKRKSSSANFANTSIGRNASPQSRRSSTQDPLTNLTRFPTGLCSKCFEIVLHRFVNDRTTVQYHRNFVELVTSAKTCVLCCIFAKQAPLPPPDLSFTYDSRRAVVLSAARQPTSNVASPSLNLDKLIVHLPITKQNAGVQRAATLPVQAQLVATRDSPAATTGDVAGRRVYGGTNIVCATNWLADCVMHHTECRKSTDLIGSLMYAVPPRLLDLGCCDSSAITLIDTDHNFASPYVALTYTRGTAKVLSTNLANLDNRRKQIGTDKFNKTFKQAIYLTRMFGFRYLWIDAYCIVMDSPQDRTKHVPRMGIIYHNAALTLSAAVSASADDGLIRYKANILTEAKIPYRSKDGTPLGHFFATNSKPRDFNEDIANGELNQRGWCLQARALSRRTLHFGNDQLFWECDAGVWKEGCAIKYPPESLKDPLVHWRMSFVKYKRGAEPEQQKPLLANRKTIRPTSAMLVIPKIYHLWYSLITQYTGRILPREKDKSSGIAGLAYIFACLISQRQTQSGPSKPRPDTYVAGLWQNDLPFGLLWSSGSFHKWRMKFVKYPSKPRAPSWSWLSVEGPMRWPDGAVFSSGSFTGRSFMKVLDVGSHYDKRSGQDFATLRIRGKVALLSKLYGFRPEDAQWKREARDHDMAKHGQDEEEAEGPINLPCAMFDSSEVARVWSMLHGGSIDQRPNTGSSSEQPPSSRTTATFGRSSRSSTGTRRTPTKAQGNYDQQKDFVALLVIPAGCTQQNCAEHSFEASSLLGSNPEGRPKSVVFVKNNCGQGLAYALILYPSSMGEGLFRRVGIAQVRIADFATVERRRDREIVVV